MHAGIGKDHAKFSPVATASYRLLPEIVFPNGPITGEDAVTLQKMCPMGVFDIEDIKGAQSLSLTYPLTYYIHSSTLPGRSTAVTARPRDCTMCRECTRHDGWNNKVNLRRIGIPRYQSLTYTRTNSLTYQLTIIFLLSSQRARLRQSR